MLKDVGLLDVRRRLVNLLFGAACNNYVVYV